METKELKKVLAKLSKCVSDKTTINIAKCIKIENGYVFGTDLCNYIKIKVDGFEGLSPCLINFSSLKKILGGVKSKNVFFQQSKDVLQIILDNGQLQIQLDTDPEFIRDFPITPSKFRIESGNNYVDENHIKLMKQAYNHVIKDELRPVMEGVCLDNSGNIVSTDGEKLYFPKCEATFGDLAILDKSVIPLLDEDIYLVNQNESHIQFENETTLIISRKIEGKYPNWKYVVPTDISTSFSVKKNELIDVLKLINSSGTLCPYCKFTFHNDTFNVSNEDIDVGTAITQDIEVVSVTQREDLVFGIKTKLLLSVLPSITEDNVTFNLSKPDKPIIINNYVLVMPVAI